MSPKDADRMANSVDPDQTTPLGANCSSRSKQCRDPYQTAPLGAKSVDPDQTAPLGAIW